MKETSLSESIFLGPELIELNCFLENRIYEREKEVRDVWRERQRENREESLKVVMGETSILSIIKTIYWIFLHTLVI